MISATNLAFDLSKVEQVSPTEFPGLLNLPHIEKTFWRGMTIYSLEDAANHLYVILKGRVKVLRSSPDGQQKIVSIRYRDDLLGELALTGNASRRMDEAIALDTTRVAMIRVGDFWNAARRDSTLMQNAMQYLAGQLSGAYSQIESLVFENNHRRLAQALLDLSGEAARAGESNVRLTHEELAQLIGSTREVVTGMMIEFRQSGLIDYKRGDIRPNLPRLTRFLQENMPLARRPYPV
ncbi:MAG: Crp/Fnr family transcriptional regulator [Acidobacteriota bacterium]|nr:Crp/Fnr family transcriptional regulator [Acidobacteriota bacterium]